MKRTIVAVVLGLVLLLVIACAPKQVPTTTGEAAISPEETEIVSELDDINELDTLDQELNQDVSFDEVDQLLK
ncbi:hypothetical protein HYT55_05730 [Candidatus Woesearchaeota archaeon]|nr:hypothetical protein [Candidatus Woesearchaeota archaeon]